MLAGKIRNLSRQLESLLETPLLVQLDDLPVQPTNLFSSVGHGTNPGKLPGAHSASACRILTGA